MNRTNPVENIESLWMEKRKEEFRREHELDRWRTIGTVAIVAAICGWVCAVALFLIRLPH